MEIKLLLANKYFFLKGGSEKVYFQERDYLKSIGFHIYDLSMKDSRNICEGSNSYFVPNINFQEVEGLFKKIKSSISFISSTEAVNQICILTDSEKLDIAHLHNIYHQLTPAIIPVLKKKDIPIVLTLHDLKLICPSYLALRDDKVCTDCNGKKFWKAFITNCQNSWFKGLLLSVEAIFHQFMKSYENVDIFLAPSQFMADMISRRIDSEKIKVLRNGVDTDKYIPQFEDDGYGLYLGRLSKEKGVRTLLEAYKKSKKRFSFKIVGSGPLEDDLKIDFPDSEFLGYKTGDDLENLVKKAAFVVVPSEWYENCSMVVLEAMAYGKPVIGSRIGGIPEQIDDEVTGLLFEMGNSKELAEKMDYLAENSKLRRAMGMAAREKVEREFSLKDHCESLVKIYENLLK